MCQPVSQLGPNGTAVQRLNCQRLQSRKLDRLQHSHDTRGRVGNRIVFIELRVHWAGEVESDGANGGGRHMLKEQLQILKRSWLHRIIFALVSMDCDVRIKVGVHSRLIRHLPPSARHQSSARVAIEHTEHAQHMRQQICRQQKIFRRSLRARASLRVTGRHRTVNLPAQIAVCIDQRRTLRRIL